jgi:hypothetical protein
MEGRGSLAYAEQVFAVVLLATLTLLASPRADLVLRTRRLIIALAAIPIMAIFVLVRAGKSVVIPRYATAAVPFLLIAIAAATRRLRPVLSKIAVGIVMFVMVVGSLVSFSPASFYPARCTRRDTVGCVAG